MARIINSCDTHDDPVMRCIFQGMGLHDRRRFDHKLNSLITTSYTFGSVHVNWPDWCAKTLSIHLGEGTLMGAKFWSSFKVTALGPFMYYNGKYMVGFLIALVTVLRSV